MSPRKTDPAGSRRLAAVWFADIVGYTALSTGDEPLALRIVELLQTTSRQAAEQHGGTVVKFLGDGVLAQFPSAEGAAQAALQLQLRFEQMTEAWEGSPHRLRIGVHLGDVMVRPDGDIMGDGVNRASRLQGLADPGQVLVSDEVYRQLRRRPDVVLTDCGTRTAKGIDEPIAVYQAEPSESLAKSLLAAAAVVPQPVPRKRRQHSRAIAVGMATAIISFVALGVWTALGGTANTASMHEEHTDSFSVAVLPFHYLSSDEQDAYLADGVSEELIHGLSAVPGLRVASRTSSFQYRDAEMDIGILADRLGVFMIIEGSVTKIGDDLRITAQLTDADHGQQLWSERWDARIETILDVQQEIAEAVVAQLLGRETAAANMPTRIEAEYGTEAYQHLLRGRHSLNDRSPPSLRSAVEHFERALALAPNSPEAHLSMAQAQMALAEGGSEPMSVALPQIRSHLDAAVRLAPDMTEARAGLAWLMGAYEWDWDGAEREFTAALASTPPTAVRRSFATFLAARGRYDEALGQLDLAFHQEPGAVPNVATRGLVLFQAQRYLQARVVLGEAVRLGPEAVEARVLLARTHLELGDPDAAHALLAGSDTTATLLMRSWAARIRLELERDQPGAAQRVVRELQQSLESAGDHVPPDGFYWLANVLLAAGDQDGALESLNRAFDAHAPSLMWLPTDPMWESLNTSAQFQAMVNRIEAGP